MINLSPLHTFAFDYQAQSLQCFHTVDELLKAAKGEALFQQPHFILGGGSNTLFCEDFAGVIVKFEANQLAISEDSDFYYLTVDAGFNWHQLVKKTVEQGIYGLENLALIPGLVGAAPIQNIGAYGLELGEVLNFVEFVDKQTLQLEHLSVSQLQLGYRDSIFKRQLAGKVLITKVGFKLSKNWQPNTEYKGLQGLTSAKQIYQAVVALRQCKLPDPAQIPNSGSFFKNPVISQSHFDQLKPQFNDLPGFKHETGVKVPAAWLIEHCALKGFNYGGVGVYAQHGLVLVNHNKGTGEQLIELIRHIRHQVRQVFAIELEIEVRLVGRTGLLEIR